MNHAGFAPTGVAFALLFLFSRGAPPRTFRAVRRIYNKTINLRAISRPRLYYPRALLRRLFND